MADKQKVGFVGLVMSTFAGSRMLGEMPPNGRGVYEALEDGIRVRLAGQAAA